MQVNTQITVLGSVGGVLVVLGSIFAGVFPTIYNSIVDKMLVVSENSTGIDAFLSPPVPIYMQFYLFNVTNPDDIRYRGAKPIIREVGPYTYEEKRQKHALEWNHKEGTVSYFEDIAFFYNEEMSEGHKETEEVTTLNAVMVLASGVFANHTDLLHRTIWTELENGMDPFEVHTVAELLFDGYELPLFDFDFSDLIPDSSNFTNATMNLKGTLYDILEALGVEDLPESLADNKIAYLNSANNTHGGRMTVSTGENGINDYLNVLRWNNETTLKFWDDQYCDMINGTDGSQFPPRVSRKDTMYIFVSGLCRSLYLNYERDLDFRGVHTYRFVPPRDMLEDPLINNDNLCYCVPDEDHCLGAGFLNLSPCAKGAPVIMSTPHFYQGDDNEREKLDGLDPRKERHETFLDVEPRTGVTMRAAKKIQINLPLRPYGNLPSFKNVPEVIFPVLWINESAEIDDPMAKDVNKAVSLPFVIVNAICGCLIAIGLVLLMVGGLKHFRLWRVRKQQKL